MNSTTKQLPIEEGTKRIKLLRVGSKTSTMSLAQSVIFSFKEHDQVRVEYLGAGAGNIVNKAIAVARGEGAKTGLNLWSYPIFRNLETDTTLVDSDGKQIKSGMAMIIENIN